MQGLGQGHGFTPAGWASISTPLINMMRTANVRLNLLTALSKTAVSFVCYAFVDDTDLIHCGSEIDIPGSCIVEGTQRALDHWEGGLRATGGAVIPDRN